MNEGLLPEKDQKAIDIEVVKEQVLDLNDKFDYLMFVLMKERRVEAHGGDFHFHASPTPTPKEDHTANYHSATSVAAQELEEIEIKDSVKKFEQAAKKKFGLDRQQFRKATPR